MNTTPLSKTHRIILGLHAAFAVVFAVVGFIDAGGADGWADLARVATLLLAAVYLTAAGTVAALARYLIGSNGVRTALVIIGPPILIAVAIFAIQNA